jgi:hypothetical protein
MKTTLHLTVAALTVAALHTSAATLYVSLKSTNPVPPYNTWATAATGIQDALEQTAAGDAIMVTNGVYPGGVVVVKPVALLSINGPLFTAIDAGGTKQCVSLTNGSSLSGFTVTNGFGATGGISCASTNAFLTNCTLAANTGANGGGVSGGTLYNCTLSANLASGGSGGGAYRSILYNCRLSDNSGTYAGAAGQCALYNCVLSNNWTWTGGSGADGCTLYKCTLLGHRAVAASGSTLYDCVLTGNGYGAASSTLYNCTLVGNGIGGVYTTFYNCIVYFNTGTNYDELSTLSYCCTMPMPTNGVGNITNAPLFIDVTNGNLRLQSNSPCVNSGNNANVATTRDMDGRSRIVGNAVDIGAYEFQPGISGAFIDWLQRYGLPTDGSADYLDSDADGLNNWQEWRCGTDPTNSLSALRLVSAIPVSTNVTVIWQSVGGVNYSLERSTNLGSAFIPIASGLLGQSGTTEYTDTNTASIAPVFYGVGVAY